MRAVSLITGRVGNGELNAKWKRTPEESDVDRAEYDRVFISFSRYLKSLLGPIDEYQRRFAPYFVGDFTGDRTQQLQFVDFVFMTPQLVHELQGVLRRPEYCNWRIVIWAPRPEHVVIIYSDAIWVDRSLREDEIEEYTTKIARRWIKLDAALARERRDHISRVKPFLHGAYQTASKSAEPMYLVHSEAGWGREGGIIRLWVIHLLDRDEFDLDEYDTRPRASHSERFFLMPDGSIKEVTARMPADALLIVLWELRDDGGGKVCFTKGSLSFAIEY